MISKKDGFWFFRMHFPQFGESQGKEFSDSLGLLAKEVDESLRRKSLNTVGRAFGFINFLVSHGNDSIRMLVWRNFFKQLKSIPVQYLDHDHPVDKPFQAGTIKRYRIHYRVSRESGYWCVKSININL